MKASFWTIASCMHLCSMFAWSWLTPTDLFPILEPQLTFLNYKKLFYLPNLRSKVAKRLVRAGGECSRQEQLSASNFFRRGTREHRFVCR